TLTIATQDQGTSPQLTTTSTVAINVDNGFLNQTITYQYLFPTASSVYYQTSIAVGSGVTHSGIYSGSSDPPDVGSFTISATQITFNFTSSSSWTVSSYNGWHISEPGAVFVGFSVDPSSNMLGLTNANLSFDANDLYVNWQGLYFYAG